MTFLWRFQLLFVTYNSFFTSLAAKCRPATTQVRSFRAYRDLSYEIVVNCKIAFTCLATWNDFSAEVSVAVCYLQFSFHTKCSLVWASNNTGEKFSRVKRTILRNSGKLENRLHVSSHRQCLFCAGFSCFLLLTNLFSHHLQPTVGQQQHRWQVFTCTENFATKK